MLINRLSYLTRKYPRDHFHVHFDHDSGAFSEFQNSFDLQITNLSSSVGRLKQALSSFDAVFCIDAPKYIALCSRAKVLYFIETHSTYSGAQDMISASEMRDTVLIVPSRSMVAHVSKILGPSKKPKYVVLPNLMGAPSPNAAEGNLPNWKARPVLYFGRMDKLKNPMELVRACQGIDNFNRRYLLVFAGPQSSEIDMHKELTASGLRHVLLPSIPFSKTSSFLKSISSIGGLFVSTSTAESNGLAVREALAAGLETIITDLPAHREVAAGHVGVKFYDSGDFKMLAALVEERFTRRESLSSEIDTRLVDEETFQRSWETILEVIERKR